MMYKLFVLKFKLEQIKNIFVRPLKLGYPRVASYISHDMTGRSD